MTDLFEDIAFTGWECPQCGWLARDSAEQIRGHQCEPVDLDIRITQFLNRWTWRQDTATVRTELEALIAEARKS